MEKSVSQSQSQTPTLSLSPRLKRRRRRTAIETLLRTEKEREKRGKETREFIEIRAFVRSPSRVFFCVVHSRRDALHENWKRDLLFPHAREATLTRRRRRRRRRTLKKNEAQRKETNTLARQNDITYRRAQGKLVLPDRVLRADFDLQQPLFP